MRHLGKYLTGAAFLAAAAWAASSLAQPAAAPFTARQAEAGRVAYAANCASCHQANLAGSGEQPALAGVQFMAAWGRRTTKEFYDDIHAEMPYGKAGSLDAATYQNITAFVMSANGAKPGNSAFDGNQAVRISTIATGQVPPAIANARRGNGDDEGGGGAGRAPAMRLGQTLVGSIKNYTPVTDAMLVHPDPKDWLIYRGNYQAWSHSGLSQINANNVGQLQLKWSWAMNEGGENATGPTIHDGIMFLANTSNTVEAFDAKTGELLWQNRLGPLASRAYSALRSLAVYEDKVYINATDAKLYALDAKTGKVVWESDIAPPGKGFNETGGLIVAHGKAIVGLTLCRGQMPHCYISAYDANTGKQVWKFTTIAAPGTPGGDTWANVPDDMRAGGETWIAGTYDPELNITYWGTAQSKPWMQASRRSGTAATLYANSTLALDADTGQLKWYFSHAPGETFDLDEVFERVLIDHGAQKTLMTIGKAGILWKLDRVTGKFLDAKQTVFQNVYTGIDMKTGRLSFRPDVLAQKTNTWISSCPSAAGGHDWPPTSYDQKNDLMIIPLNQSCNMMLGHDVAQHTGVVQPEGEEKLFFMPGTDGNMGRLAAYRTSTMEPIWSFQQRSSFLTGVLSTDGNVSFVGDYDRVFRAIETTTGKTLWTVRLPTVVQGNPVSFAVDGKQYVAITTGLG
ncbi:MAG TPA: PQQ-binding-like beta-propeller repeat protein, partial [Rhizomicrobium sp.]|nr:PQQ-binding-like beta-propeller repeat protein [Rhizomicrobium sp.]